MLSISQQNLSTLGCLCTLQYVSSHQQAPPVEYHHSDGGLVFNPWLCSAEKGTGSFQAGP